MAQAADSGRINSIQNLRGIASFMVCLFHLTSNLLINDPIKRVTGFGYLGVEMFFIISGFVIPWSLYIERYKLKNFADYLSKRVIRISPPYLASIVLVLLFGYLSSKMAIYRGEQFRLNFIQILLHIVYLPKCFGFEWIQPVYPTLLVEFQFYILIGLLFPLLTSKKRITIFIITAVFIVISYEMPIGIFGSIDLFLIGIVYFKYRAGHLKTYDFWMVEIIIMIFTLSNNADSYVALAELTSIIGIMYWESAGKVTQFLGKISYSLYLIHVPIGGKIINLGNRYSHSAGMSYLVIVVALLVSVGCSYVFYQLVESPCIRMSKQLIKKYS